MIFEIALQYPKATTIHLVLDNLNIHRHKSLTDIYGNELGSELWNRFTIHYTPNHGSWLNQAEIEIGLLSRQCLGCRRIPDPGDATEPSARMEPASQPRSHYDQLEVQPQGRAPEVRLSMQTI